MNHALSAVSLISGMKDECRDHGVKVKGIIGRLLRSWFLSQIIGRRVSCGTMTSRQE
jgi:hypothetical protein